MQAWLCRDVHHAHREDSCSIQFVHVLTKFYDFDRGTAMSMYGLVFFSYIQDLKISS